MSTHNIGFYEDLTKIIFELSSNTHLISSAGNQSSSSSHVIVCLISSMSLVSKPNFTKLHLVFVVVQDGLRLP